VDPAAAHARQLKGLGLYGKDLSRRDLVKVAQYEVLGNDARRRVRPARDDRNTRLWSHAIPRAQAAIDHPIRIRDGCLLKPLTQHFVLGYFHRVPYGTDFL
jgi:hypothetical protein